MNERTGEKSFKQKNKRSKKAVAVLCLLFLFIVGGIAFFLFRDPYDGSASTISKANASYEDIVAELDKRTEESRLWISVASTISCDSETGECTAHNSEGTTVSVIDNVEQNNKDMSYTFYLEDGSVIYESDLIQPGQSIERPVLDQDLTPGTYNITVTAQGYDVESHKAVGGTVNAQVTLNVE